LTLKGQFILGINTFRLWQTCVSTQNHFGKKTTIFKSKTQKLTNITTNTSHKKSQAIDLQKLRKLYGSPTRTRTWI